MSCFSCLSDLRWPISLQDISFSALPGNRVEIVLTTSEPVGQPAFVHDRQPGQDRHRSGDHHQQPGTEGHPGGIGLARSVTAIEAGDRDLVVINPFEQVSHEIRSEGNKLIVSISCRQRRRQYVGHQHADGGVASSRNVPGRSGLSLQNIDFAVAPRGEARVEIELSDPRWWWTCASRVTAWSRISWILHCHRSWRAPST